jgi:hypothetical protein
VVEDHDVPAERALMALGGEMCVCLAVLDCCLTADAAAVFKTWGGRSQVDPSKLEKQLAASAQLATALKRPSVQMNVQIQMGSPSSLPPQLAQLAQVMRGSQQQFVAHLFKGRWTESVLWALSEDMRDRLALSRVVQLARAKSIDESLQATLDVALTFRARPALEACFRHWVRQDVGGLARVACRVAPGDDPPVVIGSARSGALVTLPLRWLPEVWGRGLALVDGCFVVSVTGRGEVLEAEAVRWDRQHAGPQVAVTAPALLWRGGGCWHLRWR